MQRPAVLLPSKTDNASHSSQTCRVQVLTAKFAPTSSARSAMAQIFAGRPDLTTLETSVLGMDHFGATLISYLSFVVPRERPLRTVGSGSTVHCPENSYNDTANNVSKIVQRRQACSQLSPAYADHNSHWPAIYGLPATLRPILQKMQDRQKNCRAYTLQVATRALEWQQEVGVSGHKR